jgi:hypothetical protein
MSSTAGRAVPEWERGKEEQAEEQLKEGCSGSNR